MKKGRRENGYVLAVKGNQPTMESEVKDFFGCKGTESRSSCETIDKGHGRIEKRIYTWAIENNLHWSLDVLFLDDDCPVLDRNTIVISVGRNNCRK